MAKYQITSPEGGKFEITAPDTATEQEVMAYAQKSMGQSAPVDEHPVSTSYTEPSGFLGNVYESLVKRGGAVREELGKASVYTGKNLPMRLAGQGAGFLADVQGEALKSAYGAVVPESVQGAISTGAKNVLDTKIGQAGLSALQKGMEYYNSFKQSNPEVAKDIEAIANIASLVPVGAAYRAEGKAIGEGVNIGKDVTGLALKKKPHELDRAIVSHIKNKLTNIGIKPMASGAKTQGQIRTYYNKAQKAVESIIENKSNLSLTNADGIKAPGLPTNLHQFSEAIEQSKQSIFQKFDDLAKEAGEQGASVDLNPIAKELNIIANHTVTVDNAPMTAKYAKDRAVALAERGSYTTVEAQEAIQVLNRSLDSFYKAPSYDTASKAYIDALIVNNMRKSLDDVVENTAGSGYQELKNTYGSLKTIEDSVNKRYLRDATKSTTGLLDLTDIYTGTKIIQGLTTLSPTVLIAGTGGKIIKAIYKIKTDPNRMVKQLFEGADTLITKKTTPFMPKSAIGKKLQNKETK